MATRTARPPPNQAKQRANKRKRHQMSCSKRNDERCRICKQWTFNPSSFQLHFVRCTECPFSYHRHCIESLINPSSSTAEFHSCSSINRQCSKKRNRSPSKLFTFVDAPYRSIQFTHSVDGKKIFIDSIDSDPNATKQSQKRYESSNLSPNQYIQCLLGKWWKIRESENTIFFVNQMASRLLCIDSVQRDDAQCRGLCRSQKCKL